MSETATQIDTGARLLTNSRMSCGKSCLYRHWLMYELGIRPDVLDQPLRMGDTFHIGLDARAQGQAADKAIESATAGYAELPTWAQDEEQVADWLLERETVARMLSGYFWRWEDTDPLEVIASELEFNLPLRNPETGRETQNFRLAGKIDKIARLPDGRLAVVEHKTTVEDLAPDSDYWKQLRIDQQISLYVLAARELGHDIQTVLYDVARKPLIRPRRATKAEASLLFTTKEWFGESFADRTEEINLERETVGMWGARFSAEIVKNPDWYFARREIPRLDADLELFAYELWQMQGLIRDCQRLHRWPRNTNSCRGRFKCPMWRICTGGIDPLGELPAGLVRVGYIHPELQ